MTETWTTEQGREYFKTGNKPSEQSRDARTEEIRAELLSKPNKADEASEKRLQSLCEQMLNREKIAYLHLSPMAREKKGWPDLTFALWSTKRSGADPIAVELKAVGGRLSQAQKDMLNQMRDNGWKVYVIRSEGVFYDLLHGHPPEEWEE